MEIFLQQVCVCHAIRINAEPLNLFLIYIYIIMENWKLTHTHI